MPVFKILQTVLWFCSMQVGEKWYELAGFSLALNYVICGRAASLDQLGGKKLH